MVCLFLFHIDYTVYAYYVFLKKTLFNKRGRTHYKIWIDLDTCGSDSVFSFIKFTREVKVVEPYFTV